MSRPCSISCFLIATLVSFFGHGTVVAGKLDFGTVIKNASSSGQWHSVLFHEPFEDGPPIVLLENQAGEVRASAIEVRSISSSGFEYRFGGVVPVGNPSDLVRLSYLAAAHGEFSCGGLAWKAGVATVAVNATEFDFPSPFVASPVALAQVLNTSGVAVNVTHVDASGVGLAFAFDAPDPPATLDVKYIAAEIGTGAADGRAIQVANYTETSVGVSTIFPQACSQPVIFAATQTNGGGDPVRSEIVEYDAVGFGSELRNHNGTNASPGSTEVAGYISLGQGIRDGGDQDLKLEIGELQLTQLDPGTWIELEFTETYRDPVVIFSPLSFGDPFPSSVRIRNLSSNGCEIQVGEGAGGDGVHGPEISYWMVMESGSFTIGGRQWEAGTKLVGELVESSRFSKSFSTDPVLLAQIATSENSSFAWARPDRVDPEILSLSVAGTETMGHELVHFLALEPGRGEMALSAGLKFESKVLATEGLSGSSWRRVRFSETFAAPYFFAHVQDDVDPTTPETRHRTFTERKVDLHLKEDLGDAIPRRFGLLLFGDTRDRDGDGMPDLWEEKYTLNPDSPVDAKLSSDDDALSNLEEYLLGTNPRKSDTDDDGIEDHLEAASPLGFDPIDTDSDHDELLDGIEWNIIRAFSGDAYGTQFDVLPNADWDGDGVGNLAEVLGESDPLDFYNGAEPLLLSLVPDGVPPFAPAGSWLHHPISLKVSDADLTPLSNAPVRFAITAGEGRVAPVGPVMGSATGLRETIIRTDSQGVVRVDWKMGSLPNTSQTLTAFVSVGGKLRQLSFAAFSLAAETNWDLGALAHFSASRGITSSQGSVTEWNSVGGDPTFSGTSQGPISIGPTPSDRNSWIQFDGNQFLTSSQGIPSTSSVYMLIRPDEAINLQQVAAPESQADALRGLSGQRYLLGAGIPTPGSSPHVYHPYQAPVLEPVFQWMSHYIHVKMLASGKYQCLSLANQTNPGGDAIYRFDVTNAVEADGNYPNNVERRKDWGISETIQRYHTVIANTPNETYEWINDAPLGFENKVEGGQVIFKERKVRFQRRRKAIAAEWNYDPTLIGSVVPALAAGTDGFAFFELNSSYAPQLGGWAVPLPGFTSKGDVVSFGFTGSGPTRRSQLDFAGLGEISGSPAAGGELGSWTTIGALPNGTQGYSGRLGELVFLSSESTTEQGLAEDRLAASYRLSRPDRNSDGLPDWWVRFLSAGIVPVGDPDNDGLNLNAEWSHGTHPLLADSDGDGIDDGDEVDASFKPLNPDSDEDGIPDGSDDQPLISANGQADADENGVADGQDHLFIRIGLDRVTDSDGDGISDFAEREVIDRDPNDSYSTHAHVKPGDDFDGDDINNLDESEDGTSLVDRDDYFFPVVFDQLFGHQENVEWEVETNGRIRSSRLSRNASTEEGDAAGGISHHEVYIGSRLRFQILPLSETFGVSDQVVVGFRARSGGIPSVMDPIDFALAIRRDSSGQARILIQDASPVGTGSFAVSDLDLIEIRLERSSDGASALFCVYLNQEIIASVPLPQTVTHLGGMFWDHDKNPATPSVSSPLAVCVRLAASGAGVRNMRYRRITDPDRDHDRMSDDWELAYGLDPGDAGDAALDVDLKNNVVTGDGLTNLEEYQYGTNPNSPDTDQDGIPDKWEVENGLDPRNAMDATWDLDPRGTGNLKGDGLSNLDEFRNGTDPNEVDSDHDGLWDGWEVTKGFNPLSLPEDHTDAMGDRDNDGLLNQREFQLNSNPDSKFSAGDGLKDSWKDRWGINPNVFLVADADPDGDRLTNAEEHEVGTDPNEDDTDKDGMIDGWEYEFGAGYTFPSDSNVAFEFARLDPLDKLDASEDPDGDRVKNIDEFRSGTNPQSSDTDGDGMRDDWEIDFEIGPTDPGDALYDWDYDGLTNLQEYRYYEASGFTTQLDPLPKWSEIPISEISEGIPLGPDDSVPDVISGSFNRRGELLRLRYETSGIVIDSWSPRFASLGWTPVSGSNGIPFSMGVAMGNESIHQAELRHNSFGLIAGSFFRNEAGFEQGILRILKKDGTLTVLGSDLTWKKVSGLHVTESGFVIALVETASIDADEKFKILRWRGGSHELIAVDTTVTPVIQSVSERGEALLSGGQLLEVGGFWAVGVKALSPYGQTELRELTTYPSQNLIRSELNRLGDAFYDNPLPSRNTPHHYPGSVGFVLSKGKIRLLSLSELFLEGSGTPAPVLSDPANPAPSQPFDIFGQPRYDEQLRLRFDDQLIPRFFVESSPDPLVWSSFVMDINNSSDVVGGTLGGSSETPNDLYPPNANFRYLGTSFLLQAGRDSYSRRDPFTRYWRISDLGCILATWRVVDQVDNGSGSETTISTGWKVLIQQDRVINGMQDALPNDWELYYFGQTSQDPLGDPDRDGANNQTEHWFGLNPTAPDTDKDGAWDMFEIDAGGDPRNASSVPVVEMPDSDRDGLNDYHERAIGTNPNNAHSDDDGLPDGFEIENGFNPLLPDSDGDGFNDYWETKLEFWGKPANGVTVVPDARVSEWEDSNMGGFRFRAAGPNRYPTLVDGSVSFHSGSHMVGERGFKMGDLNAFVVFEVSDIPARENEVKEVFSIGGLHVRVRDGRITFDAGEVSRAIYYLRENERNLIEIRADRGDRTLRIRLNGYPEIQMDGQFLNAIDSTAPSLGGSPMAASFNLREFIAFSETLPQEMRSEIIASLVSSHELEMSPTPPSAPIYADSDGDLMPDWWEVRYGLAPATDDSAGDSDGDHGSNLLEFQLGTDPQVREDEDGDRLPDYWERKFGLSVGIDDSEEDPDSDKLSNYDEFLSGGDPVTKEDSDEDGMPDWWEARHQGLNPGMNDADGDLDSDWFTNLEEFKRGLNPLVAEDADGDQIFDGWEVRFGLDPDDAADGVGDLDLDLLSNLLEFSRGTNPHAVDSDGDSYPDWIEVCKTTDPLTAESVPLPDFVVGAAQGEFASISAALLQITHDGQIIEIKNGTYDESIDFSGISQTTLLRGGGHLDCVVRGDEEMPTVKVTSSSAPQFLCGVTITHGQGQPGGGVAVSTGGSLVIARSVIVGNRIPVGTVDLGAAATLAGGSLRLENSIIVRNSGGDSGAPMIAANTGNLQMIHSTVAGNFLKPGHAGLFIKDACVKIRNSIFWHPGETEIGFQEGLIGIEMFEASGLILSDHDFSRDGVLNVSDIRNADPWLNPDGLLTSGSAAVNSVAHSLNIPDDLHGEPRPSAGSADYGADEFVDRDGDGMPDWFEIRHGLDPDDPSDANSLAPNGISFLENYLRASNPYAVYLNPVDDYDSDGLLNGEEAVRNTNPDFPDHPILELETSILIR